MVRITHMILLLNGEVVLNGDILEFSLTHTS